jgi:hypothetical protein
MQLLLLDDVAIDGYNGGSGVSHHVYASSSELVTIGRLRRPVA